MRILTLTILFFSAIYYFNQEPTITDSSADTLIIKQSAPDRAERILTVEKPKLVPESDEIVSDLQVSETSKEEEAEEATEEGENLDGAEEVQISEIEEGWNSELKSMLNRLEPIDGDHIHKTYLEEQQNYQAMLDNLMNDKELKTSTEAALEVDQLMTQLDQKHQERLKEILGTHYESIRDHYEEYLESSHKE
jgi:hypothetical protein